MKRKGKKRDMFSIFGWGLLLLGGIWMVTRLHSYVSISDLTSIAAREKKKQEQNKIKSLGGGSRPADYEKQLAYYGQED